MRLPAVVPVVDGTMARSRPARLALLAYAALFLLAAGIAALLIRPFQVGQVGFDSAASVIYFDHILQGRHLEAFITTTPKPLLTLVYGVAYNLTGDWRWISWLTIAMFGLSTVLVAILAGRASGLPAATFAAAAVIGSESLLGDIAMSYAVVWAFVACLGAGLLVTSTPARYAWAGLILGIGVLARFEVILILGLALVVLAGGALWARYRNLEGPDPRAWRVLVGFLAVPIQALHDWLLSGNPLYALYVPVHASLRLPPTGPLFTATLIGHHLIQQWPLVILAVIGGLALVRSRGWGLGLGILAMGPGVAAFLLFLAYRGTYISGRYFDPIDLALIVSAAIGFGLLVGPVVRVVHGYVPNRLVHRSLALTGSSIAAIGLSLPFAPMNPSFQAVLTDSLASQINVTQAVPVVRSALAADAVASSRASDRPLLSVPILLRPEFIVDLGLSLTHVGGSTAALLRTDGTNPVAGELIVHDRGEEPDPAFSFLEVSVPTTVGRIVVVPLLADSVGGVWVDRIEPAP